MTTNDRILSNGTTVLMVVMMLACMSSSGETSGSEAGINDARRRGAVEKRDPFWPVGYQPKNVTLKTPSGTTRSTSTSGGTWNEAMKQVIVNGVSSRADNEYFAVINGEVKSVGDTVSVRLGNSIYTWAVDGIEPPVSVKLRRVSVR